VAGYSGTPLPQKLGIKPGHRVALVGAPRGFAIEGLPAGAGARNGLGGPRPLDVVLSFVTTRARLGPAIATAVRRLDPAGGLWICWPKKASGVTSDVTEDRVREVALAAGLVDNKVCAIDQTWSGLRLVVRLADRPKPAARRRGATRPRS
jgi:hypothetical protein